ncbi:MAG TPA: imidazole glycerol phosphate synthase subunit HisH [Thiothrix sp.]|nr:imidazole glycerol phosphate synthase subunit HisH [Thiothrix sp.]
MSFIAVIDYGMGNLRSVSQAVQHVSNDDTTIMITADQSVIQEADRIVFPGQGAARDCMRALKKHNLVDVVLDAANTKPFLGICMGMQVLMDHSEENGGVDCLGKYAGNVRYFSKTATPTASNERIKIPQMGWNQIYHKTDHPLWAGIPNNARFYFVHSYYVTPDDDRITTGETEHGLRYTSALAQDNVFAIQAHPEKSADDGLRLLKNFTRWNGSD